MSTTKKQQEQRRKTLRPHPMRDKIIDAMAGYGQPISPSKLADITHESLGSVAYHVRTLVAAGVVELADEARVRGAVEHFYAFVPGTEPSPVSSPINQLLAACNASMILDEDDEYPQPAIIDADAKERLQGLIERLRPRVQAIVAESTLRSARR
jgi:DNA-binding transcriptional ArsR family regulator